MGAQAAGLREGALTKWEKVLRALLWFIAAESALFIVIYLYGGIVNDDEFRFVANSTAKDALFAALAVVGAVDVRRWARLVVPLLILGHAVLIVANGIMLLWGGDQPDPKVFAWGSDATAFAVSWMAIDAVIIAALFLIHRAAQRERLELRYLSPVEYSTLRALAEVLIHGDDERVDPDRIARNADGYLADLEASRKWLVRAAFVGLALFPLLTLRPPFALMAPASRLRYAKRRFERRYLPWPLGSIAQPMIRTAQQFVFLGYYGDEASHAASGYVPFSKRGPAEDRSDVTIRATKPPENGKTLKADVVVVGSGAAGAIVAYKLAGRGRDVLVLERGPHVPPAEFTEDEVKMYLRLYNEGALQLSRDFRFSVLQGMCVGGTTVVNNAVCFPPPDEVLAAWNDEHRAGLDLTALERSRKCVEGEIKVQDAPEQLGTPGYRKFKAGIQRLGLPDALPVPVNIAGCLGCGYCNIGCAYGKKMSMLDSYLPMAQELGVEVMPGCKVVGIHTSGRRASGVDCEVDGKPLRIDANTVVVAAGAVSSSWLLQRSGVRRSQAGRNLHFNVVSPMTAEFGDKIDAYAGLQISHYYKPPAATNGGAPHRWLLETWFNPPATQSLVMPGWFEDHYRHMRRYDHMASAGVLVGTKHPGHVRAKSSGPQINYKPHREDLEQIVTGMKQLAEIYLAAGAHQVMPVTAEFDPIRPKSPLSNLDKYVTNRDLSLNSAHPQGGNAISTDARRGVVDPEFRVHGMDNLYVCDASVFPTSVGVNPQLTVMALADYAGDRIR